MKPKKAKAAPWFKKCNLRSLDCCGLCKFLYFDAIPAPPHACTNPKNNTKRSLNYGGRNVESHEICDHFEPGEDEE